jgi:serine/threonine protein kinase
MTDITARLSTALADGYAIESELGAGGMATVYLAEDLKRPTPSTSQARHTLPVSRNAARKALCWGFLW